MDRIGEGSWVDDNNNTKKCRKILRECFGGYLEPSCYCQRDSSRMVWGSGLPLPLWAFWNRGEAGGVQGLSQLDLVSQLVGRLPGCWRFR